MMRMRPRCAYFCSRPPGPRHEEDEPATFQGALSCLLVGLVLFSWMLVNAQAPDPSLFGQWTTLANLPFFPVHAHLLPTGK